MLAVAAILPNLIAWIKSTNQGPNFWSLAHSVDAPKALVLKLVEGKDLVCQTIKQKHAPRIDLVLHPHSYLVLSNL